MRPGKKIRCAALVISIGGTMFFSGMATGMDIENIPETITIDSLSGLYGPVEFNHAGHAEMAYCSDCHHHTVGAPPTRWYCIKCHEKPVEVDTVNCEDCHSADRFGSKYLATLDDPELFHKEKPGLKGAFHLNCIGCHQEITGPTGCEDCHTMNEEGEKRFNTGKFAPVSDSSHDNKYGH